MLKKIIVLTVISLPIIASATTLPSVINAFAIKQVDAHNHNSWENTQKIKNVKWQWKYYESGAHDFTMKGQTHLGKSKNPNIGKTSIQINGLRTMITNAQISVDNKHVDVKEFGAGKYQKISTECDIDGVLTYFYVYKYTKKGYKPLFISQSGSWGASSEDGSEDFHIAYNLDDILNQCS